MADVRTCPQDCKKCGFQQHAYCAAQMAFQMSGMISQLSDKLDSIGNDVKALKVAMDFEPIEPNSDATEENAQQGSGAIKIDSQESLTN